MTIEVEVGGRMVRVELERVHGRWIACVDGRKWNVDAVQVRRGWSILIDPRRGTADQRRTLPEQEQAGDQDQSPGVARASYDVRVDARGRGELAIQVGGRPFDARVSDPRAHDRRDRRHGPASDAGRRQIVSPMPGRVVKVLVEAGDHVSARQGLVVVEAMKMENELRAPGEAVVREVRVTQGASVDAGAVLVVLE